MMSPKKANPKRTTLSICCEIENLINDKEGISEKKLEEDVNENYGF